MLSIGHPIRIGVDPHPAISARRLTHRDIVLREGSSCHGCAAPFISAWLFAAYHSTVPIGIYVVICVVISVVSAALLTDYTNKDTSLEVRYGNV